MFLLSLCLGTILAPSCQESCQLSSSLPPSSESVGAAWSHLSSRSYDGPYAILRRCPAPSPSESGPGTRSLPSATSRPARPRPPSLADRWVHAQAALPQPSGSRSQTRWFLHLPLRRRHETVPEPFSYPVRRFLHAWDRWRHHRLHRCGTRPVNGPRHRGWTSGLFSFQLSQGSRGGLWRPAYTLMDDHTSWVYSSNRSSAQLWLRVIIRRLGKSFSLPRARSYRQMVYLHAKLSTQ
jgi:hypothetical protein